MVRTAVYVLAGVLICVAALSRTTVPNLTTFLPYLVCAIVAALALVPSTEGLIPAGYVILLLGIEDLPLPQLLFIAFTAMLLRELRRVGRIPRIPPILYAIACSTIGIVVAHTAYRMMSVLKYNALFPAPAIASSLVLLINFGLTIAMLRERKASFMEVFLQEWRPLVPWFVAAGYLSYLVRSASHQTGYHPALIVLPILFALDRGYRIWSDAKTAHRDALARQHKHTLATLAVALETLAVAIDTRDHTTLMHLRRVQLYAMAVGRELKLSEEELEALNVAALLHDIGKLAIPDHILLKPGPLTVEEWEKMKTHPMVGAQMLSRMKFPEPVLAIVKAHHERWDGTGYPKGLSGVAIPIGARILSAVDCLDAIASDRPYRSALPLEGAMERVGAETGRSFDPRVVSVLEQRYVELEQLAWQAVKDDPVDGSGDSHVVPREDLGHLTARPSPDSHENHVLGPIASARQETQLLQALATDLAHSLSIDEVTSCVHRSLGQMIAYDTLAVYSGDGEQIELISVIGENSHLFSRGAFRITKGLSGWAAQSSTPILNGDAASEWCYSNDSTVFYRLQAALAVPFESRGGMTGVLTLYHPDRDAFCRDDLRVAQAASLHIGPAIENAFKYRVAEESAVTDHLTGIPNGRSLAVHLERELARAGRENATIGVLVCDLDGFKQVNDRFGHLTGNEVLQRVANGLRDTCRSSDYLARMGGDEFVVVLPGLREELCSSYVTRLNAAAVEAGWIVCGERCLSLSIGVAIYPTDGKDAKALLAEADRRMYRAKNAQKHANALAVRTDVPA